MVSAKGKGRTYRIFIRVDQVAWFNLFHFYMYGRPGGGHLTSGRSIDKLITQAGTALE